MNRFSCEVLNRWLADIFTQAGCPADEAVMIAENLVDADASGHPSHGIVRVPRYIDYIRTGAVRPVCEMAVITETPAMVLLDGQFSFGQVLGHQLIARAEKMAAAEGLALIGLRHAGHLGRIGAWAEMLADRGFISVHFVNVAGSNIVAPFGARTASLSTAPVAIGVPSQSSSGADDHFILDFATSRVAEGKILVSQKTGTSLPHDAMVDAMGADSDRPETIYGPTASHEVPDPRGGEGAIQTFGGHKGSGLGLACELLAGALTGSGTNAKQGPFCNGMLSVIINPQNWDGDNQIAQDVREYVDAVRACLPRTDGKAVMIPGDPERTSRTDAAENGLILGQQIYDDLVTLSHELNLMNIPAG